LAAGWKNRRGITVAKNCAFRALILSIPLLVMLGVLATLCLAPPAVACFADQGARVVEPLQKLSQHHHLVERQADKMELLLEFLNQNGASGKSTVSGNLYSKWSPPKFKIAAPDPAPKDKEPLGALTWDQSPAFLTTLVLIATIVMALSAAMATSSVMASTAAAGATTSSKRAACATILQGGEPVNNRRNAGVRSRNRNHQTYSKMGRASGNQNQCRRRQGRHKDEMNRWSMPGAVHDVEQQIGEYGVDWDEWVPSPG
jgi:hypothetical protein